MKYEIFISYTNKEPDMVLSDKLYNALNSNYFPVFRDKKRLDAGYNWSQQLDAELALSKHLVVIWSSKSSQSPWVQREIAYFNQNRKPGMLIFFIDLDGTPNAYGEYQGINDFKEANAYPDKISQPDPFIFDNVVNKIRSSIYKTSGSKAIMRAVFTMTTDKLGKANISQAKRDEVKNNYAARYADWKPFGSIRSIESILDDLLYGDINRGTIGNKVMFHWEDIDWKEANSNLWLRAKNDLNEFISDNTKATTAEINKLENAPCVVILDPYALSDQDVKDRFMRAYSKCMMNPQAVIMALDSFPLSTQLCHLRQQLQNDAESFYENYFEPNLVENTRLAECFANTIDDKEVKRNLRVTFRNIIGGLEGSKPDNPYLNGKFN